MYDKRKKSAKVPYSCSGTISQLMAGKFNDFNEGELNTF